jgi:hypothetical protein
MMTFLRPDRSDSLQKFQTAPPLRHREELVRRVFVKNAIYVDAYLRGTRAFHDRVNGIIARHFSTLKRRDKPNEKRQRITGDC